jgi:hypothetical protein
LARPYGRLQSRLANNVIQLVVKLVDQLTVPLAKINGSLAAFKGLMVTAAAALPLAAFASFARRSFEAADALGDAAERAGVTVESLSRLKFVAEQNDVEFGALTTAIKRWQVTLSQASSGQKDASESLNLLRLNASQLKNLRLEDQLKVIADQFARIRDPADQTRVAVELFGRAGEQLVPLLNKGGDAIADLTAEADRLGITLDSNTISAVDRADKALKRFLATVSGAGQRAAGNIALAIMGPKDEIEAATIDVEKLIEMRKLAEESAKSAGPDAPAWFKRMNANTMAKVNAQLDEARKKLEALQKTAEKDAPAPLAIPADPEKISEVLVTQRKAELEGLSKLLQQFEQDTKLTEDKIYQDYLETTTKIKELQKAGIIDAEEAAKRISSARIKYESDVLIDPVKITQSKVVVQQVLSEQQKAVDKFVDTLQTGLENLARSGELTGRSILKYLLSAFQAQVLKDAIAGLGNYLKGALGGTGGSSSSAFGSFLSGLFGAFGHAAGGGRGGVRWVGEDGPELDTGGGNIMNRRQLAFAMGGASGGGVTVTNNNVFNVSGTDPAATAQYIESRLQVQGRKQLEQFNRLLRDNYGRGLR